MWFIQPKIEFGCNQCGECCRHMDIQLTHFDIARILKSPDSPTMDELITLYEGSADSPDAVLLYGHYRIVYMSNRLNDNACIFLQDDNRCGIYEYRPNSCQTWPFSKDEHKNLQIDPSARPLAMAQCDQARYRGYRAMKRVIAQGVEEVRLYWLGIQAWNKILPAYPEDQTLAAFLEFMWARFG